MTDASGKSAKPKRSGRPATGKRPLVAMRLATEVRQDVEQWATEQPDQPNVSEALRRLIDLGLKQARKRNRTK